MRNAMRIQAVVLIALACHGCATPGNRMKTGPSSSAQNEAEVQLDRVLSLARLHERQKKTADAVKLYEGVLEQHPQNALAHHRLGVISAANGEFDDAHQHFAVAISSGKPSSELLNDVGYVYYLQSDYPNAEAKFREALKADVQSKQARINLGLALGFQQRFDESFNQFRRAGDESAAYNNLAYVQSQLGFVDQAVASYHRSLNLNPQQRPAAEALVQLTKAQAKEQAVAASHSNLPSSAGSANTQFVAAPVAAKRTESEARRVEEVKLASYTVPTSETPPAPSRAPLPPFIPQPEVAPQGSQSLQTAERPGQTTALGIATHANTTPPSGQFIPALTGPAGNSNSATPSSTLTFPTGLAAVPAGAAMPMLSNAAVIRPTPNASPANVSPFTTQMAIAPSKPLPATPGILPAWVPGNLGTQPTLPANPALPAAPTRAETLAGGTLAPVVTPDAARRSQIPVPVATSSDYWSLR